jgi:hypothetical protein
MLVRDYMKRGRRQDTGSSLPSSHNYGEGFLGQAVYPLIPSSKGVTGETFLEDRVALPGDST